MKRINQKHTRVLVSFALILTLALTMVAPNATFVSESSKVALAANVENALTLSCNGNSWSSGFSLNLSVTNQASQAVSSWKLIVDKTNFTISDIWCAEAKASGNTYIITPANWAMNINSNGSVNFGFCGTGTMPTENLFKVQYVINGVTYPREEVTPSPTTKPTSTPTKAPTPTPTKAPTPTPTKAPTPTPTKAPTPTPTKAPTPTPTKAPTPTPTKAPTPTPSHSTGVAQPDDDWLHVEGTNIVDKNGKKVWLTGANWFGFNCRERMFLDSYHSNIVKDIEIVADKGINVVRMPIATDLLYAWSQGEYPASTDTSYNNKDLAGLNSWQLFNFMLENFKRVGIKVILDVHGAETDNMGHNHPVWYKGAITEEIFKSSWVWIANQFKNDDTIIGFDLKNEPHTNTGDLKIKAQSAIWDDSNHQNNWKRVAQETALAIMKVHPNALIFVEGVEIYPKDSVWDDEEINTSVWFGKDDYYCTWWGGNLRGVKDYPIDLGQYQKQLVYSPHDYGPIVYNQTWFQGEFETADDDEAYDIMYNKCWRDNWGYIMEDGIAPLLVGEWGGITEGSNSLLELNKKYLRCMRDYIIKNKYSLHHTFWCINIDSADTNGLFTRDEGTPFEGGRDLKWNDYKYDNFLLPCLWKNDIGRFQGLDHEIPLGKNGDSL